MVAHAETLKFLKQRFHVGLYQNLFGSCQDASSFKFSIINNIHNRGHEKTTSDFLVTLYKNLSYTINTTQHSYMN